MRGKNVIFFYSLILILVSIVSACNSTESQISADVDEEVITLKLAHESPENSTIHGGAVYFTEKVTELTDGKIQFEIYPAEQMGSASDYLALTRDKVVDISYHYPAYTPSEMPYLANISGLPGLYTSNEAGTKAYWDLVNLEDVLETDFLSNGVRPLAPTAGNSFELFTTGIEIKTPHDLKGLQIRSSGGVISQLIEHFNANPIQMPIGDAYTSLDQGVIDAVNTGFEGTRIAGIEDLVKSGTKNVAFGANMAVYSINEDLFQSFPEDIQEALLEAGQESSVYFANLLREGEDELAEIFEDKDGVTIHEPTGDVAKEWNAAYEEFIENYLDEEYQEAYEFFREAVDSYTE